MPLCSCKLIFSLLEFVVDLHQAISPWGTLNLAHCANYLWKKAHSRNHQFRLVLKLSWASAQCAPFPMKDGDAESRWSRGVHLQYSVAPHPSCDRVTSVFITPDDLELISLLLCCFPFVFVQYPLLCVCVCVLYLLIYKRKVISNNLDLSLVSSCLQQCWVQWWWWN